MEIANEEIALRRNGVVLRAFMHDQSSSSDQHGCFDQICGENRWRNQS
jgi:hypothetical protein